MHRRFLPLLALAALIPARAVCAEPAGSAQAAEASQICSDADDLAPAARRAQLERGLRLAEEAVRANPEDAAAHFAIVCNLGKKMRLSGVSFFSLFGLGRLKRAVERTVELAPDDPDALAAKGALLVELPRLLGGNREEGERLLRRALALDPAQPDARAYLGTVADSRPQT